MNMTDYTIISGTSISTLIAQVKEHLSHGWSVTGGVAVVMDSSGIHYIQTMVLV